MAETVPAATTPERTGDVTVVPEIYPERLGRLTTIASWVLRAITTTASSSGEGFSSRWGVKGGTNT